MVQNSALVQLFMAMGLGLLLYHLFFRPIGQATCLFDDPNCLRLKKRQMGDAFLVDIPDSGETLWYNGKELVAYNLPTGDVCNVGDPGYAWLEGKRGFFCVKPLAAVRAILSGRPLHTWSKKLPRGQRSVTGIAHQLGAIVPT